MFAILFAIMCIYVGEGSWIMLEKFVARPLLYIGNKYV